MAKSYLESLLGEKEHILMAARQHWFTLAGSIFIEILVILLILIGTVYAVIAVPEYQWWIILIGFVLILLPIASLTRDTMTWTNRQYIITNLRVMQIAGVLNKNVTDSSLEKVNDVKLEQSAFGRIFGYGDIEILTASELGVNKFNRIGDPIHFKTTMLNAKVELETEAEPQLPASAPVTEMVSEEQPAPAPMDVPVMIAQLAQLRHEGIITEEEFQQKKADLLSRI